MAFSTSKSHKQYKHPDKNDIITIPDHGKNEELSIGVSEKIKKIANFKLAAMEYLVIYEKAEDGTIWAQIPDLPGCFSSGFTLSEAKQNVRDAIELHLEGLHDEGIPAPLPTISFELVEV